MRDYAHKELVYRVIANKVTKNDKGDQERVLSLFKYVHEHLYTPFKSRSIDVDQLHHLTGNIAWCDSQASTLVALTRKSWD